jgi:hypothetical protein
MLVITKGVQTDIMVTLQDSITLLNPYYLFVFTNVSTKEELKVIVNSADDKSNFPNRINVFEIDNTLFDDLQTGQYIYEVYEQLSSTNEDTTGLNLVENGRMILKAVGETTNYLTGYSPQTQFV